MINGIDVVNKALEAKGKPYVFGAEVSKYVKVKDAKAFDCSELVEAVCRELQTNPMMPDGSYNQFNFCCRHGLGPIPLEQAWKTAGALLFRRNKQSKSIEHVAISLGDNKGTMEARGKDYGCNTFAKRNGFTEAALIPGVNYKPE
jgi:cell wall-associated NlpC family hydrolase